MRLAEQLSTATRVHAAALQVIGSIHKKSFFVAECNMIHLFGDFAFEQRKTHQRRAAASQVWSSFRKDSFINYVRHDRWKRHYSRRENEA